MRLEVADDDIGALGAQALRVVEHVPGLADARRIPEIDFQFAAGFAHLECECGNIRRSISSVASINRSSGLPPDQVLPAAAGAVADENLGDAVLARELQDRLGGPRALEHVRVRAHFPRQRQVRIERRLVLRAQPCLPHIDRQQFAVEALGIPRRFEACARRRCAA